MARDRSRQLRRAGLAELKADQDFTDLVPVVSIHPQAPLSVPTWPFTRWGAASSIPRRAGGCLDGSLVAFSVHAFAKARMEGDEAVETAEDHAHRISAGVATVLGGKRLDLGGGEAAALRWTRTQVIPDGAEPHAFHGIIDFEARILS